METAELVLVRWGEVKRVVVVERATMTTIASQEVMILA